MEPENKEINQIIWRLNNVGSKDVHKCGIIVYSKVERPPPYRCGR